MPSCVRATTFEQREVVSNCTFSIKSDTTVIFVPVHPPPRVSNNQYPCPASNGRSLQHANTLFRSSKTQNRRMNEQEKGGGAILGVLKPLY